MKNKMIIFILFVVFLLVGCQSTSQEAEKIEIQGIQSIQYEELKSYLDENIQFILYIGRPDCGDCQEFYPILEEYIDNHEGTGIYYLNIKEFRDQARSDNASQEEIDFFNNLYEELHFDWTPTIHVISNGDFTQTYQYLDEDYYEIKDENEREKKKEEFIQEFQNFMNDYFNEKD